MMAIIFFCSP